MIAGLVLQPPNRRFWFCRADGGRHFGHFRDHNLIALGHVDKMKSLSAKSPKIAASKQISSHLKALDLGKGPLTSHLNQTLHFMYDARVGDLVLSVSDRTIYLGRIASEAYFERETLKVTRGKGELARTVRMDSFLRRKVKWIASFNRYTLPHQLQRAISSHQTFFNLDAHERDIYSMVAPYVYKDGALLANLQIKKNEDIGTDDFSRLTSLFLKAEFIARKIGDLGKNIDEAKLDREFAKFRASGGLNSSLIAEFASPGRTANKTLIPLSRAGILAMVLSGALFGGKLDIWGMKAELSGAWKNDTTDHVAKELTDLAKTVILKWLEQDGSQLKKHLVLQAPGNAEQIKEIEKKD